TFHPAAADKGALPFPLVRCAHSLTRTTKTHKPAHPRDLTCFRTHAGLQTKVWSRLAEGRGRPRHLGHRHRTSTKPKRSQPTGISSRPRNLTYIHSHLVCTR